MILALALIVGLYAAQEAGHPQFRPLQKNFTPFRQSLPFQKRFKPIPFQTRQPVLIAGNEFFNEQRPAGQCSIPLVNARGLQARDPMPSPQIRNVDPGMMVSAPAPPCENWFQK